MLRVLVRRFGKLEHAIHRHSGLRTLDVCPIETKISVDISIRDNESYVSLFSSKTTKKLSFLLDSGASLSFVSKNAVDSNAQIDRSEIISVVSATGHTTKTLASLNDKIIVGEFELPLQLHIFDETLSIKADGILGMDFFLKYNAIFDLCNKTLSLLVPSKRVVINKESDEYIFPFCNVENDDVNEINSRTKNTYSRRRKKYFDMPAKQFDRQLLTVPLFVNSKFNSYTNTIFAESSKKYITIPELSTKYLNLKVNIPNGDYILASAEILPNVISLDSIIRVNNNKTMCSIHNANDFPVLIFQSHLSNLTYSSLNEFSLFTMASTPESSVDRNDYINSKLKLDHCDENLRQTIQSICNEYSDCFYVTGDKICHTDLTTHSIELKPNAKPVFIKQYRLPEAHKKEIQQQLDLMESEGIIEKCSASGWNSPIILVPKTDDQGTKTNFRLVVDLRRLNEETIKIHFPIPLIDTIIDRLANCRFFTKLDLRGAFYQIKLEEKSRNYTTFENNSFSYRFVSMPQGLTTAPAAMQNTVNLLFSDLLNKGVNIYLDDILIYTLTIEQHIELLKKVFSRLRSHNFKLKVEKSEFMVKEVEYLGYIINENGCQPNKKKVDCITKYPIPTSVTELQRFLGLCNYYRKFICKYANTAKPLYELLKKGAQFDWKKSCDDAFRTLKSALVSPPVLIFPDFEQPFIVTTDASATAVGAVISQGTLPNDRPIQFVSKVMNKAQQNYSTIEKELLAIIYAVDQFRHYLVGHEFILFTDHKPLIYLFNMKNASSKLVRWRLALSEYQFKIVYKQGRQNVVADALSRINYEPVELSELVDKAHISAITRSKTKNAEDAVLRPTADTIAERKKSHNFYEIVENNDILTATNQVDHIFYFFSSKKCEMKRKWEYRMKTNIRLPDNLLPFTAHSLNEKQTIFIFPDENNTDRRIINTKLVLSLLIQLCTNNNYIDIAINIDMQDVKKYFEFKYLFKEAFKASCIKTTFYLNKIFDVVDMDHILDILHTYHNSSLAGHASFEKTKNSIRRYYKWPTMNADISRFVKNCEICKKSKITRHTQSPMQVTSTSEYPFQKVYIDFVNVEREHRNVYPCIFTCIDELTKYAIAVATPDCTALTAAKEFVRHVILKYNIPECVVTDMGSAFVSDIFKEITKLFKIKKISTTPYRPNSNIVERLHRTLAQHLITCVHANPNSWFEHLDSALFAYNNNVNSSTGFSPHELLFGFRTQLPDSIVRYNRPLYNYDSFRDNLRHNLSTYWKIAKESIDKRKQSNKKYRDAKANPISLNIGDQVLIRKPFKTHKFATPYDGPFTVEDILSPVTVKIKKGKKIIKIHTDKLKLA